MKKLTLISLIILFSSCNTIESVRKISKEYYNLITTNGSVIEEREGIKKFKNVDLGVSLEFDQEWDLWVECDDCPNEIESMFYSAEERNNALLVAGKNKKNNLYVSLLGKKSKVPLNQIFSEFQKSKKDVGEILIEERRINKKFSDVYVFGHTNEKGTLAIIYYIFSKDEFLFFLNFIMPSSEYDFFLSKTQKVLNTLSYDGNYLDLTSTENKILTKNDGLNKYQIKRLQKALTELDYDVGGIDGKLGGKTKNAIIMFQEFLGIETTGEPSLDFLERTETAEVQNKLTKSGFYEGPINGEFGNKTSKAIKDFQIQTGIAIDGKISENLFITLRSNNFKQNKDDNNGITISFYRKDTMDIVQGKAILKPIPDKKFKGNGKYSLIRKPITLGAENNGSKIVHSFETKPKNCDFTISGEIIGPYLVFWFEFIDPITIISNMNLEVAGSSYAAKTVQGLMGNLKAIESEEYTPFKVGHEKWAIKFFEGSSIDEEVVYKNHKAIETPLGIPIQSKTTFTITAISKEIIQETKSPKKGELWHLNLTKSEEVEITGGEIKDLQTEYQKFIKTPEGRKIGDDLAKQMGEEKVEDVFSNGQLHCEGAAKIPIIISSEGEVYGEGPYSETIRDEKGSMILENKNLIVIIGQTEGNMLKFNEYLIVRESENKIAKITLNQISGLEKGISHYNFLMPLKENSAINKSSFGQFESSIIGGKGQAEIVWKLTK